MPRILFIFLVLFCLGTCQQLINLSSLKGGNVKNQLNGGKEYGIYVSAMSDSASLLNNISVVQEDGEVVTLEVLKNRKVLGESGEIEPYVVSLSAYVTTNLTDEQMKVLTGVMFLCTPNQLDDADFHVIDVSIPQLVDYQELGATNSTILFLNTDMDIYPYRSSIISQWSQPSSVSIFMYPGFPTDKVEATKTQIFSNPMHEAYEGFFSNVEKFSMITTVFYLKTFNGSPKFKVEPGDYNIDRTTTTDYNTTGFYMNQLGELDEITVINTKRDTQYSGSIGANIIGQLPADGTVTIEEFDGLYFNKFSTPLDGGPIVPWSAPAIGQILQISSRNVKDGQYYVQYFVRQGQLIPVTSTSTMMQTSTSIASSTTTATPAATSTKENVVTSTTKPESTKTSPTTSLPATGSSTTAIPSTTITPPTTSRAASTTQNVETTTKSSRIAHKLLAILLALMCLIWF